jgi:hypothetical protein
MTGIKYKQVTVYRYMLKMSTHVKAIQWNFYAVGTLTSSFKYQKTVENKMVFLRCLMLFMA